MKIRNLLSVLGILLLLASCGSKKVIVNTQPKASTSMPQTTQDLGVQKLTFVQKVSDNQLYQKNVVGDMSFSIKAGNLDQNLPGSLHMRKDEVIRLQIFIPLLGSEVGRLEFTPNYVLVVDRIHRQYVKAQYSDLTFLKDNGLNFYSLQALFWNQLLLPGQSSVSESDLKKFNVQLNTSGSSAPVTLRNGKMNYQWMAEKETGRIVQTNVSYVSDSHGSSTLNWKYDDFKNIGVKSFPVSQMFSFTTTANGKPQQVVININLDGVSTDSNWEAETVVSNKYKQVDAKEALSKLLNL